MPARHAIALALLVAVPLAAAPSDWNAVAALPVGTKVQVAWKDRSKPSASGVITAVTAQSISVREEAGEVVIPSTEVKKLRAGAPERRLRRGLKWMAIAGGIVGFAGWGICVHCRSEGHPGYIPQGIAIGAGIGALMFLPLPYRTVYQAPKK